MHLLSVTSTQDYSLHSTQMHQHYNMSDSLSPTKHLRAKHSVHNLCVVVKNRNDNICIVKFCKLNNIHVICYNKFKKLIKCLRDVYNLYSPCMIALAVWMFTILLTHNLAKINIKETYFVNFPHFFVFFVLKSSLIYH